MIVLLVKAMQMLQPPISYERPGFPGPTGPTTIHPGYTDNIANYWGSNMIQLNVNKKANDLDCAP